MDLETIIVLPSMTTVIEELTLNTSLSPLTMTTEIADITVVEITYYEIQLAAAEW